MMHPERRNADDLHAGLVFMPAVFAVSGCTGQIAHCTRHDREMVAVLRKPAPEFPMTGTARLTARRERLMQ